MIIKTNIKIYLFFLFTLFPIWIFKSDLSSNEIIISILLFYIFPFILILLLFINSKNKYLKNLILILVLFFSIDSNFKLWELISFSYFEGITKYYSAIAFSTFTCTILFYLYLKLNFKFLIIAISFLISGFVMNIFTQDSNIKNIREDENNSSSKIYAETLVIIILDELNSFKHIPINSKEGKLAINQIKKFSKRYKFKILENTYSIYNSTDASVASLLNFEIINDSNIEQYISFHKEHQFYKKLKKNKLFDLNKFNSISVYQNNAIDFCAHKKVKNCQTFNHFSKKNIYLEGFRNNYFSVIISKYNYHNSIFARFLSRFLSEFKLIHLHNLPRSNKAAFENTLNSFQKEINLKNHDLYFAHFIVPHKPYAYDKNCNYDPIRITNQTIEKKLKTHYIEIYCVFYFLDNFIKNLRKDIPILILSDHGSRIENTDISKYSTFFAVRNENKINFINKSNGDKISTQMIFNKIFNINNISDFYENMVFDYKTKQFREISY